MTEEIKRQMEIDKLKKDLEAFKKAYKEVIEENEELREELRNIKKGIAIKNAALMG